MGESIVNFLSWVLFSFFETAQVFSTIIYFRAYPAGNIAGNLKYLYYSVLKLLTGFAIAAFIAWKLIVASAIIIATSPPAANNHQLMLMR